LTISLKTPINLKMKITIDWNKIAALPEFQSLLAEKRRFIISCCLFFSLYYFALLYLVGWHASLISKPILGKVNGAYLFALSQFFMAWIMAAVYMKKAAYFDKKTATILKSQGIEA
jgi:uncharacterized membrane protein (DUF485 family)